MIALALLAASFSCTPAHMADGDTFTRDDGRRVRLSAIDAPEMPGHCRRGRIRAPGDPLASKDALEQLALGRRLRCTAAGTSYDRTVAWCRAGHADLSCAQVRSGQAIRWMRYGDGEVCRR